jgi:N-terminal domain of NWD NACHT-NTPase
MHKFWKKRVTLSRNRRNNGKSTGDSQSSTSASTTADTITESYDPPNSKHTASPTHVVGAEVVTPAVPIESPLPVPIAASISETGKLSEDWVDLWDQAYKKLTKENSKLFKRYKRCIVALGDESALSLAVDLDTLGSEQREKYLANQIETRLRAIREQEWSTAGDVYKKIVETVLSAKDFVGEAVSNEPHAALAWAGVSILLPVSGLLSLSRFWDTRMLQNILLSASFY